ncbi:transglycosylase family protein [Streptomyces sp. NPDC086787]|uniref:transglycosylase family protein n=1 Tax=Streptomyces sp. NPDC086787 TaxID=3365759 RepID=UPI00380894E0
MLSGNGRHRRPRQAPALLVAAGVAGSAIAIPLLGAASASAAEGTTWDKVAECESGGSWSANTGNGYYGGLQLSQDDWDEYGGLDYAASPDEASRSQQIAVAERILDRKGTAHWATCALLSGLTSNSGSVDVDTGVGSASPDADGSSGSSGSSGLSGSSGASGTPSTPSTPSGSPDSGDSSKAPGSSVPGSSSSDADAGEGADKKGDPAGSADSDGSAKSDKSAPSGADGSQEGDGSPTEGATSDSDKSAEEAGSWNLVDTGAAAGGRHRGASADESEASGQGPASSGRHASQSYTVRVGDTLCSIADSLDVDGGWRALYAANKVAIGGDPNAIMPGQTLEIGTETDGE